MEHKSKKEEEADIEMVRAYTIDEMAGAIENVGDAFAKADPEISVFAFCTGLGRGVAEIILQTMTKLDTMHPSASKIIMQQLRNVLEKEAE